MAWDDGGALTAWARQQGAWREHQAYTQALEQRAKERADRERREAEDREIREATALLDRDFRAGAQRLYAVLERRHGTNTTWTTDRPPCAIRSGRRIYSPPIQEPEDLGTWLHELGHHVIGSCPQTPPHHQVRHEDNVLACVQCEVNASTFAMQAAPFTARMHRDLAIALSTHVRGNPSTPEAQATARRFVSGAAWFEERHRRVERDLLMEKVAEVKRWASEPRVLTRRERQWQEMNTWAKEAGHGKNK